MDVPHPRHTNRVPACGYPLAPPTRLGEYVGHVNASKIKNYNAVNSGEAVQSREENEDDTRE
jgi:hypothetical protein